MYSDGKSGKGLLKGRSKADRWHYGTGVWIIGVLSVVRVNAACCKFCHCELIQERAFVFFVRLMNFLESKFVFLLALAGRFCGSAGCSDKESNLVRLGRGGVFGMGGGLPFPLLQQKFKVIVGHSGTCNSALDVIPRIL